jgi:hypothetical protein
MALILVGSDTKRERLWGHSNKPCPHIVRNVSRMVGARLSHHSSNRNPRREVEEKGGDFNGGQPNNISDQNALKDATDQNEFRWMRAYFAPTYCERVTIVEEPPGQALASLNTGTYAPTQHRCQLEAIHHCTIALPMNRKAVANNHLA